MDSKQLIGYMTRPETLKDGAVQEMEQLVADYPYFAIGQALLTVAYQNTDDKRYESQLRHTAAIMPNRDKLRLFTLIARHRWTSEPEVPALPDEIVPAEPVHSDTESVEPKESRKKSRTAVSSAKKSSSSLKSTSAEAMRNSPPRWPCSRKNASR